MASSAMPTITVASPLAAAMITTSVASAVPTSTVALTRARPVATVPSASTASPTAPARVEGSRRAGIIGSDPRLLTDSKRWCLLLARSV